MTMKVLIFAFLCVLLAKGEISFQLPWSQRMMLSEIERFPEAWMLDYNKKIKWSYPSGLVLKGAKEIYERTKNIVFYDYISDFGQTMVNEDGTIKTYDLKKYNLDMLNNGNVLLYLYPIEKKEKYLKAIQLLRSQIREHPRTSEGGFWHKEMYPKQMWLDGLYMAEPFYAHYTEMYSNRTEAKNAYNDIILQFDLVQKHLLDEKTGLLYHGWEESRQEAWSDNETGHSPHFWGRAMGWYGMAIVDVLDYLPFYHIGRQKLISYLNSYARALVKVQDKNTGLWYQILDKIGESGNYLEATASSMFVYTFAKAVRKGYLTAFYKYYARKGYNGLVKNLISVEPNGLVNLNQCCAVAGLGGKPYRNASYEYYVNEKVRSNDPKGTGPFILASLEFEHEN
ncbi:uncharacterized protein LOC116336801 [Contarinia nasturtii]|uniref:uncharacterized protein LOC116336801 n=1 Tax=Contarinia nasturtii TaxID=265458 RepID=UPI0012D47471|nr:uncharacterized protein LOC116336801 [Contarinia nasturtii]